LQFSEFEEDIFRQSREVGFGATLATLGLNAYGAFASGGTANVLAAISGGIIGARAAYDREILAERTIIAIHTQMRANRTNVLARLRAGLRESIEDYPIAAALADLEDYYHAGTMPGAIIGITESAGAAAQDADERLRVVTGMARSAGARALQDWAEDQSVSAAERENRRRRIQEELQKRGVPIRREGITATIRDPEVEKTGVLQEIAEDLGLRGS
jgi:hypothetical protein